MATGINNSWISSITAVSTTVAATLLVGFLGTFKDLAAQAPLITSHMQSTSEKLVQIEDKQGQQALILAGLANDYASREVLRAEVAKLDSKIQELQVRQAVLQQVLDKPPTRTR